MSQMLLDGLHRRRAEDRFFERFLEWRDAANERFQQEKQKLLEKAQNSAFLAHLPELVFHRLAEMLNNAQDKVSDLQELRGTLSIHLKDRDTREKIINLLHGGAKSVQKAALTPV